MEADADGKVPRDDGDLGSGPLARAVKAARRVTAVITPSAQRSLPAGDGTPDLVRRIFLEEMDPRDRYLGLRWP
jgi:hypothetical protein